MSEVIFKKKKLKKKIMIYLHTSQNHHTRLNLVELTEISKMK